MKLLKFIILWICILTFWPLTLVGLLAGLVFGFFRGGLLLALDIRKWLIK